MKLYATTTSERASKGQGGQYLLIDIYDEATKKIANLHIYLAKDENKKAMSISLYDIDMLKVDGRIIETKGEKKKGEKCEHCEHCNTSIRENYKGSYCENCGKLMMARI